VRGRLPSAGWGAGSAFPCSILDDTDGEVPVDVLESPELAAHWDRLDEFEGDEERRVPVTLATDRGQVEAFIYVVAAEIVA
jgi:gamma-glutamylcyclotransferase (GGCT)/AIG2-like uncharacterized protein YtfP